MAIERNPAGPTSRADLYQIGSVVFWDKTRPEKIAAAPDDEPYRVKDSDRIDLLAFNKLGDSDRGWIIMLRNDMRLMPNDLVPGTTIMIPSIDSLRKRGVI